MTAPSRRSQIGLAIAVVLVAANLRPAITSVAPLLTRIRESTGLSGAEAGLLTTIPLIAFCAFSLLAPALGRRVGMETTVVGALALLVGGIVLRSAPTLATLLIGTEMAVSRRGRSRRSESVPLSHRYLEHVDE